MPFEAICCCDRHYEWKHGKVNEAQLRQCTRQEASILNLAKKDPKNKGRKRRICVSCRSRLEVEVKCQKLEEICTRAPCNGSIQNTWHAGDVADVLEATAVPMMTEVVTSGSPDKVEFLTSCDTPSTFCVGDVLDESENMLEATPEPMMHILTSSVSTSCDKGTQKPPVRKVPYKELADRTKRLVRADMIELLRDEAMKTVHFVPEDLTSFMNELLQNKNFCSAFGLEVDSQDISKNPTMQSLVKEYQVCVDKEKKREVKRRSLNQTSKVCIGNSLKDSRVTLTGEKTPEHFKDRVTAANSIGRLTCYADERRRLLSIVAMDYPYSVLQDLFDCSSKTIAAAKVHCILFGRGGTPPAKFKFRRQCVSPEILMELSEFFNRESVSRPSSCRSVMTDGQETPVRYWKDNIKELVNQYLLEFPNGIKRTYIYTHLPSNFRYNTMLAGLCNLCDEFGYSNYEKFTSFLASVERATTVSVHDLKAKVLQHQRFMKTQFAHQVKRHSPCLELCMNNAFDSCSQPHDMFCPDACGLFDVCKQVHTLLSSVPSASERGSLTKELDELMKVQTQYVAHLLRTRHQGEYYKYILDNLQPGEAVVIVDYKMKLELGVRTREIQRDWYGKRGISLHGFLAIAQVGETERRTEVIDLWSEDTKQDAWFSQSAMDVGFRWMEKEFPGFRVYLFSDNGPHYHNTGFILYLAEVSKAFQLTLVEYNNFEAGEGKSKLDTHFAHISHKIVRWVRVGNNLETGSQLGEIIGSMKNVTCRKLLIDRSKAPEKLGTLKDISLFGSFQFPTSGPNSGGLVARSLAGIGKELKKTQQQLKSLANRTSSIAGATGAVTSEELPLRQGTPVGSEVGNQEVYSVRFVQHEMEHQRSSDSSEITGTDRVKENLLKPGFAIKSGGAKRTVFSLQQKEVMIEFYNRQANYGIRADPSECISTMRERGLEPLKESQIKSWWSTYHQKRKREMESMAADIQNLRRAPPTGNANQSSPSSSVQTSSAGSTNPATAPSSYPASASTTVPIAPAPASAPAPTTSPPVGPNTSSGPVPTPVTTPSVTGTDVGCGITEWLFPSIVSQSTLDGRNGSNACTFIALCFGSIYHQSSFPTPPVGQPLNRQWEAAVIEAIRAGNDIHDELFGGEGINVAVDDAVTAAGDHCRVGGILHEYNVFGANPLDQFASVIDLILQQKQSFHVLVVNDKTMIASLFLFSLGLKCYC